MPSPKVINIESYISSKIRSSIEADNRPYVFLVGQDKGLLNLREQLLGTQIAGIRSMICGEAAEEARSPEGRVWIFCSTIELSQLIQLACTIRRFSRGSRLLLLEGPNSSEFGAPLFDRILLPMAGVDELLRAVEELSVEVRGKRLETDREPA